MKNKATQEVYQTEDIRKCVIIKCKSILDKIPEQKGKWAIMRSAAEIWMGPWAESSAVSVSIS